MSSQAVVCSRSFGGVKSAATSDSPRRSKYALSALLKTVLVTETLTGFVELFHEFGFHRKRQNLELRNRLTWVAAGSGFGSAGSMRQSATA